MPELFRLLEGGNGEGNDSVNLERVDTSERKADPPFE